MSKTWDYNNDKTKIVIDVPVQKLRITGHRISSILGLNKYQTPFGAWAEITKLVKLPFEDSKYTLAGKAIEPKLIAYLATKLPNVVSIEEYYGNNFDYYRYNNFIDDSDRFGGVIDAVATLNDKVTMTMIGECKTSSKPQDWANGNVPVDYLLQGCLYSYIKGLDRVVFICAFLKDSDYNHPEMFEVNENNTVIIIKKLDECFFEIDGELLNIKGVMEKASKWWDDHILTGVSPEFDEKKDKEYLDIIRATDATKDNSLEDVCMKAFELSTTIANLKEDTGINALEKELKQLKDSIKNKMIELECANCGQYKLSKRVSMKFDEGKFKEEHTDMYEDYCNETVSYTLTEVKKKDEE